MYSVKEFIKWALKHVDPNTIPWAANLALPNDECGIDPAHYLFGTVWKKCTPATIQWYWDNHYANTAYSWETYQNITSQWSPNSYATDCQGLCDAYLSVVCNDKTDITSNANYVAWCSQKGKLDEISRPYVIGEALFMARDNGHIHHVGFICGFDADGEPLAVEARNLVKGVVITRVCDRPWTHRGLMTEKFYYGDEHEMIIFEYKKPNSKGTPYRKMQEALNAAGYTDANGDELEIDGKWGKKSQQAFDNMLAVHVSLIVPPVEENKRHEIISFSEGDVTVCIYGEITK